MNTFFLVQKVAAFIVVWFMEILQLLLFKGLRFVIAGELFALVVILLQQGTR